VDIRPQEGPQEDFLTTTADIALYGGEAGSGKSYGLLIEGGRHFRVKGFTGMIFRRTMPEIERPGALWDESFGIFSRFDGQPKKDDHSWHFSQGSVVQMDHLEHEETKYKHHGGQYCFIGFDELTTFTKSQFWYLFSRNRSVCGIRPYMRATCNADAESWVRDLIDWWIAEDGFAIPERSGVLRWFVRDGEEIKWVDKDFRDEDGNPPNSFTFIPAKLDDNQMLMKKDPQYKARLRALPRLERERLMKGNWNITAKGGIFDPSWFKVVKTFPEDEIVKWVRYWDRAATIPKDKDDDPDWTAGSLCGMDKMGNLYIKDIRHFRETPAKNREISRQTAVDDGFDVSQAIEREPGSAGVEMAEYYKNHVFKGFICYDDRPTGDKRERAKPWADLAERNKVFVLEAPWNRKFFMEVGTFPFAKKDMVDSISGAYKILSQNVRVIRNYSRKDLVTFPIPFHEKKKHWTFIISEWVEKNLKTSTVMALWNQKKLYAFVENEETSPTAELNIKKMIFKLTEYNGGKRVSEHKLKGLERFEWFGNSIFFKKTIGDMQGGYRKQGINVREPLSFDEPGSIVLLNRLFNINKVVIHSQCPELMRQLAEWSIEKEMPSEGYGLARALCNVVSILVEQGKMKPPQKALKPYSKKSLEFHREVRRAANEGSLEKLALDLRRNKKSPAYSKWGWI
jgi:phage terminase large subunit-like protein